MATSQDYLDFVLEQLPPDIEDRDLTERVLTLAEAATSVPKPRKKGRGEK